ncbi:conserved hypothetical protein [Gloeothece citriformis PCC 7424]|uniref:Integral membrane protein TerC n=2 Tax=Gloeothece TaxID=28070 RepID=B7KJJ0_GLOC7|nr:conserved hypothetical protein [Gloeothece citriformis PCC 7424]
MAICSETWLIVFGGIIGIITLRLSAGLFLSLLDKFVYLQDSAYIIILGIGLKLLAKALLPSYILPDSLVFSLILLLFIWGFSKGFEPKESGIN